MNRKISRYEHIVEEIKEAIASGALRKDDRLDTELELGEKYHVSRVTVRKAFEILEQEDLIYRRQGSGSYATGVYPRGAKALQNGSQIISLVIPFSTNLGRSLDLLRGASDLLASQGYQLTVQNTANDVTKEREILLGLREAPFVGYLFYPSSGQGNLDILYGLRSSPFPLVLLDKYLDNSGLPTVVSDNLAGAKSAVAHLTGQGHRNIAFVSDLGLNDATSVRDRYLGYCAGLTDAGIELDVRNVVSINSHDFIQKEGQKTYISTADQKDQIDVVRQFITTLLHPLIDRADPPTALVVLNDYLAIQIVRTLSQRGVQVPGQISVIGFDNIELSEHVEPPLTTVEQDLYGMGSEAARVLVERIREIARPKNDTIFLPTKLIVRASTAAYNPKDEGGKVT